MSDFPTVHQARPETIEMEDFSSVWPGQNRLQSAPTIELCFIHEFAANCYEFLRHHVFDEP